MLSLDDPVQDLCKKANRGLQALVQAKFSYCRLIQILHSRQNNNKIKHLNERHLQLKNDKLLSYEETLEKDMSVSVHHAPPAKWVSRQTNHGTLKSIVVHYVWPTRKVLVPPPVLPTLQQKHGQPCYRNASGKKRSVS